MKKTNLLAVILAAALFGYGCLGASAPTPTLTPNGAMATATPLPSESIPSLPPEISVAPFQPTDSEAPPREFTYEDYFNTGEPCRTADEEGHTVSSKEECEQLDFGTIAGNALVNTDRDGKPDCYWPPAPEVDKGKCRPVTWK